MKQINHKQLRRMLGIYYASKEPLYIWGAMGIGKSQAVKDYATENNLQLIDIRISQLEPTDLRGIPKIEGNATRWIVPSWLPTDGNGILFFDELNLAPPSIQAAAYQLILDRRLGEYVLPDGWLIVSAGNRLEDKANVFEIPAPLANRYCHLELCVPSIEHWMEWAMPLGIDSRIVSFLAWKRDRLFFFDSKMKDRAFPTPRTWEKASKLIKGITDKEAIGILIGGAVGEATALEFIAFLKLQDKINIEELLENPERAKDIQEIDLKYSMAGVATDFLKQHKDKKTLAQVCELIRYMEPEFGALLLRMLRGSDIKFFELNIRNLPIWSNYIYPKLGYYLRE